MPRLDERFVGNSDKVDNYDVSETTQPHSIPITDDSGKLPETSMPTTIWNIEQPSITSPTDGETDFTGTITSSPFTTTQTFCGNHDFSDWEIASDENFTNIVESSYHDTTNLTSYTPTNLDPSTTYYVRVRYSSDNHISPWSEQVQFTTAANYIETPTVSCSTGDSLYPTFNLTPFNTFGYTDNWQSTDWEIATDSDFNNVIRSYTETNPDNQDTWSITDDLLSINSTYYVRARYNGDQGHSSSWSDPYVLNTGLYDIEYTIPSQANEQTTINIHVTHDNSREFNASQYTLHGSVTAGTLTISDTNASWTLPDVTEDTTESITLWVTRNSDSAEVTEHLTKSLTVKAITMVTDDAVVISDFSQYDYDDGWDIAA